MTNQMVTFEGGKRFIATSIKRKEMQQQAQAQAEAVEFDYYAPLTVADVLWSIAIYGGFILAMVFTGVMIGGVL